MQYNNRVCFGQLGGGNKSDVVRDKESEEERGTMTEREEEQKSEEETDGDKANGSSTSMLILTNGTVTEIDERELYTRVRINDQVSQ